LSTTPDIGQEQAAPELRSATVRRSILQAAESVRQWTPRWKTGIYPSEMATFIGVCDALRIRTVIDSGRGPDAYSTHMLGEYSERAGVSVYSLDLTPLEQKHYCDSLARFSRLTCLAGDTFEILPGVLRTCPTPIAMLVDGPKKAPANRLSLVASTLFDVHVVAHHNCPPGASWSRQFIRLFDQAAAVEDFGLADAAAWQAFRAWEKQVTNSYSVDHIEEGMNVGRSIEASSLMVGLAMNRKGQTSRAWRTGIKGWLLSRRWRAPCRAS
jgi:hypothetical protein